MRNVKKAVKKTVVTQQSPKAEPVELPPNQKKEVRDILLAMLDNIRRNEPRVGVYEQARKGYGIVLRYIESLELKPEKPNA